MLSKEEIEKAKERIQNSLNDICFATLYSQEQNDEDEKTLLQYIDQLEQENNKQNKIINETINYIAGLDIEDICEEIGKVDCDKMAFGECESCLREYFEKKVEEK